MVYPYRGVIFVPLHVKLGQTRRPDDTPKIRRLARAQVDLIGVLIHFGQVHNCDAGRTTYNSAHSIGCEQALIGAGETFVLVHSTDVQGAIGQLGSKSVANDSNVLTIWPPPPNIGRGFGLVQDSCALQEH